jgi:hypothetical protein
MLLVLFQLVVALIGDVVFGFIEVLLQLFLRVTAPPGRIPQFPGGLRTTGVKVPLPELPRLLRT